MLVLLMMAATGAWAQEQSETIATTDNNIVEGTHFTISNGGEYADEVGMCAYGGGITVTSKNGETITKVVISCTYGPDCVDDDNTSVSSGTKEITNGGLTITVTGVNASTFTFTCSDDGAQFGQFVVYYTEAPAPAPAGYAVSLKAETADEGNWTAKAGEGDYQALPLEGVAAGTAVSVKYNGTKKVKSVKAKKKAAKPAATVTTAPTAKTGVKAGQNEAIVNAGTAEGGTMMYMVNATQPASTDGFSATVPTAEGLTAGTYYVWYYVKADDSHTDSEISATGIEVTIAAAETTVTWTTAQMNGEFMVYDSFVNNNSHYGITVTASGSGSWEANNIMVDGPMTFTFTSTVGNIKSIVITAESINDMDEWSAPAGWTIEVEGPKTLSWNGTASASVNLPLSNGQNISEISTIVFTLE